MVRRAASAPPVIGGYSYIRPLGSGGFADVFLYGQDMPRRVVAVKVLISDAIDRDVLRTFNAEADIMARLSAHPSIVTIHQASISADGRPFLVMEYCPETMSTRYRKGALSVAEVLNVGVRIASALETAHRSGLLHRDIKPSNLLITSLGSPVLADFGIAAELSASSAEPEIFAMSVPWSSPEVLQERTSGSVSSEIYSLASTLYTLLAGRSPFELKDREKNSREKLSARIVTSHFVSLGRQDVPPLVEAVLSKAMSRLPQDRQPTMLALAEELRWAQYELGIAPTALEIAPSEWASASASVDFSNSTARGPVVSTVNADSRRARRAEGAADLASAQHRIEGREFWPRSSPSPAMRAGLNGAAVALGACGGTVVLLFVLGVL